MLEDCRKVKTAYFDSLDSIFEALRCSQTLVESLPLLAVKPSSLDFGTICAIVLRCAAAAN